MLKENNLGSGRKEVKIILLWMTWDEKNVYDHALIMFGVYDKALTFSLHCFHSKPGYEYGPLHS